jgi:hypothetical protein
MYSSNSTGTLGSRISSSSDTRGLGEVSTKVGYRTSLARYSSVRYGRSIGLKGTLWIVLLFMNLARYKPFLVIHGSKKAKHFEI